MNCTTLYKCVLFTKNKSTPPPYPFFYLKECLHSKINSYKINILTCMFQQIAATSKTHAPSPCQPCCAVTTSQKLLICHEDCQTNFYRLLAGAAIHDISQLTTDPQDGTYVIVVSNFLGVYKNKVLILILVLVLLLKYIFLRNCTHEHVLDYNSRVTRLQLKSWSTHTHT